MRHNSKQKQNIKKIYGDGQSQVSVKLFKQQKWFHFSVYVDTLMYNLLSFCLFKDRHLCINMYIFIYE